MQLQSVERISAETIEDFASQFASSERPLVITGGGAAAAAQHWTIERLQRELSGSLIPVLETDDQFKVFFGRDLSWGVRRRTMTLSDYLETIESANPDARPPYAGNISVLTDPSVAGRLDPLVAECGFPRWSLPYVNDEYRLWLGAAGQRSTIHNDTYHNFNAQIIGVKRFLVFAPDQHPALYPSFFHPGAWASPVDPRRPDLDTYPEFANARGYECELAAGEMLFIPRFWWHGVEALTFALNINRWVSPEAGRDQFWHQQPAARPFISFAAILERARQRYGALPNNLQELYRVDLEALEADLRRLMAVTESA